ncbi:MAG TPA: nucleoside triphosphate pyrophosphohydrolase [Acidimicrobiales bacterium]|nr:nucleoside triphosphate pyrophosphohydrolase [Acidimicrobiales bacterium]
MARVVVGGLGPAGPELLTAATLDAVARLPRCWLRTARHPSATSVPGYQTFDHLYDTAATLDEVYDGIVDALLEDAGVHGEILYLVPGSPLVAERTVELLLDDERAEVELLPALSFLDLAWARLGIDPLAAGVRLVDGQRFAVEAAGERGPLLVAQCDSRAVLSDVKLAAIAFGHAAAEPVEPGNRVLVLHHLGLPDESIGEVAWEDLDRTVEPDHLTSLYLPALAPPVAAEVARFAELVRTLRERCPWDREQTHTSLTRHLLEETYEVLEAIENLERVPGAEAFAHLEEELGDLLFQVVFHATLAAEEGAFTLADVARTVHDKLVGRHPHVFGTVQADTAGAVLRNWEQIKKAEKGHASLMEGIAGDLPSLLYAHKVQRKAASAGVEPDVALSEAAVRSSADPTHEEVGVLLFAAVDLARRAGVDPEAALRGVSGAFRDRFQAAERLAGERGLELSDLPADEVASLWKEAGGHY